jgi:hypothetical protein
VQVPARFPVWAPPSRLIDRRAECRVLDHLVETLRAGESQTLVVLGEPGVGKTALLDYLAGHASGCRIVRVNGDESEMELAFSGLHVLCASMLDRLDRIPAPQRAALATAFALRAGEPPDRFIVGLAVLSLLAEVAEEQPLLCLVDDAQWLDQVSALTLAFVARRLLAERVGIVFATRDAIKGRKLTGFRELLVQGLGAADARSMLETGLRARLDPAIADRLVAETRGNPLALLELPRGMTPAELAGGFGVPPQCRWRIASKKDSCGASTDSPQRRSVCCWSPPPTRLATSRWCGEPPPAWASPAIPPRRRSRRGWFSSVHESCSVIRWYVRPPTRRRRSGTARPYTAHWRKRPTPIWIPIGWRGIAPSGPPARTKTSLGRLKIPPIAPRHGAALLLRRPSWIDRSA